MFYKEIEDEELQKLYEIHRRKNSAKPDALFRYPILELDLAETHTNELEQMSDSIRISCTMSRTNLAWYATP